MKILVYTSDSCPQCQITKKLLEKSDFPFTEERITSENRDIFLGAGLLSAPIVQIQDNEGHTIDQWSGFKPEKIKNLVKKTFPQVA